MSAITKRITVMNAYSERFTQNSAEQSTYDIKLQAGSWLYLFTVD